MSNKKTLIRIQERIPGTYTVVPNSILNNKKLSSNDKILLMAIFADSDDYIFNQITYANRLGISKQLVSKSIKNLIKLGYAKETDKESNGYGKGFTYSYIFSQYGNLNKNNTTELNTTQDNSIEEVKTEFNLIDDEDDVEEPIIRNKIKPFTNILNDDYEDTDDYYDDIRSIPNDFIEVKDSWNGDSYKIDIFFKNMWDKWHINTQNDFLKKTSQLNLTMKLVSKYREKNKQYH